MILKTGTCILAVACFIGMTWCAHAQTSEARQLMQATNDDRAQHGLEPLRWDPALARAAQAHAYQMVRHGELSHQYAGEPELAERAGRDGAYFRSPKISRLRRVHKLWRRNGCTPRLTAGTFWTRG